MSAPGAVGGGVRVHRAGRLQLGHGRAPGGAGAGRQAPGEPA